MRGACFGGTSKCLHLSRLGDEALGEIQADTHKNEVTQLKCVLWINMYFCTCNLKKTQTSQAKTQPRCQVCHAREGGALLASPAPPQPHMASPLWSISLLSLEKICPSPFASEV